MATTAAEHDKTRLLQLAAARQPAQQLVECVVAAHVFQHIVQLPIERGPAGGVDGTGLSVQQLLGRQRFNGAADGGDIDLRQPVVGGRALKSRSSAAKLSTPQTPQPVRPLMLRR